MRRFLLTSGVAVAVALGASAGRADSDVKIPNRPKVEKWVEKLMGGEITYEDTRDREELLNEINKQLEKDTKGVALRTPSFWVDAIQSSYFNKRKSGTTKQVRDDTLEFTYLDGSSGKTAYAYHGGAAYSSKMPQTLLVSLLPKGTDPKAWLETNWKTVETAQKNWIMAAVAVSDKYPVEQQPNIVAWLFDTMRMQFNCDGNRWYLEGVGDACAAAQKVACNSMPDRLAGLILRNPTAATLNANAGLFPVVVVHEKDDDPVAAKVKELRPETNVAIKDGEGAAAAVAEWVTAQPGRTMAASYTFVTPTSDNGVAVPMAGSIYLSSPAKRGDPIDMKVNFDRDTNTVTVDGTNLGEFWVYMNDDLLDLDQPVKIVCNGDVLAEKTFERTLKTIFELADTYGEYGRVFTASFRGVATSAPGADDAKKDDGAQKDDAKKDDAKKDDGAKKDGK